MSKKIIIIIILSNIAALGVGVYGGMKYSDSKSYQNRLLQSGFQNMQNLSPEERQARFQGAGTNTGAGFRVGASGGQRGGGSGFAAGEILSKDEASITLKLADGGSKIIFFSDTTLIKKSENGVVGDLEIGKGAVISGSTNSDGSITANSIQL